MKKSNLISEIFVYAAAITIGIIVWRILKSVLSLILAVIIGVAVSEFLQKRRKGF